MGDALHNFSWVVEGEVAGMARPGSAATLAALAARGVRAVVTLTEQPLAAEWLSTSSLTATHLPVADFTAPTLDQVAQAVTAIDTYRAQGQPVAVHCAAGLGRTGTILACYLVAQGAQPHTAIDTIRRLRPGSIETLDQEDIVFAYAHARMKDLQNKWLHDRHQHNGWLNDPAVQEVIRRGGPAAVAFMLDALQAPATMNGIAVREAAAYILGELGDTTAAKPLIHALREQNSPLQQNIIQALTKLDTEQTLQILVSLLVDLDWQTRKAASYALGQLSNPAAVEFLIAAIEDPKDEVAESVVRALGYLGDARAVESLISLLSRKRVRARLRATAAEGLGYFHDRRAVQALIGLLGDKNVDVRRKAIQSLCYIHDPQAVGPVIPLVKDTDWYVRSGAVALLGRIGGSQAVEALLEALHDPDPMIRWEAAYSLGDIGDDHVLPVLEWIRENDTGEVRAGEETVKAAATSAIERIQQRNKLA